MSVNVKWGWEEDRVHAASMVSSIWGVREERSSEHIQRGMVSVREVEPRRPSWVRVSSRMGVPRGQGGESR